MSTSVFRPGAGTTAASFTLAVVAIGATLAACGLEQLVNGGKSNSSSDAGSSSGSDAQAEAGIQGASCGIDNQSGAQLCRATSMCPSVVIDSQAFPHCGFRIRSGAAELVCACGEQICSMGPFTTCAQATGLLTSQTESQVCVQVAEGRCTKATSSSSSSSSSGTSGSSTSSGSSGNPGCDKTCLAECGGGAACAQVCGC